MPLVRHGRGRAVILVICAAYLVGCSSGPERARVAFRKPSVAPEQLTVAGLEAESPREDGVPRTKSSKITSVNYDEQSDFAPWNGHSDELFAGQPELSLPALMSEVQRRNPNLHAALAAWGAASQRFPQVVALEDPVLQSMFAPGSFPSNSSVQPSYFVGIAQKVPWAGKRALRGQAAEAEASAASLDSQDVRLRLAEATRLAFFDYYLVTRDLELNTANSEAVERFRETASSKFESNQVTQQDVLQAEVELGLLRSRKIELKQNEKVAVARINTLLHREPQLPLPPPPKDLAVSDELPNVDSLRQLALDQRPDLAAQASRIAAEQANVALAIKEYYPDFEFMGRYDQFWTPVEQRPQVGMYLNIPLNQSRRKAAVCEAMFRVNKMQAEYDAQVDSIRNEVQAAHARLEGSFETVRLYVETILPTAQANVESANAGYVATQVDFLRLVEAERQLIELQEKHQEAVAEYHRRRAELERVVGTPISEPIGKAVGSDLRLGD
jgi:outer membrane protein TolC